MSLPADLPPPRRPLFFPVVIATVFLSIIGMSAGFVLGTHHEAAPAPDPGPTRQDTPARPAATDDAKKCPAQMHDTAQRLGITDTLTQLLRVRTTDTVPDRDVTVWICQDSGDRLYYQANRGEEARWAEGETALFLRDVVPEDGGYLAKAEDGVRIRVNERKLRIYATNGAVESHNVETF
ncbi:hypothetical protein [Couchioplanes caeruleus]|uniref:hypothetical protein n=1 Tax=Couchioplanes caeruleus TaxID=56438 RepID=UPI001160D07B|nr:hypothetical protein [Couchioplanes caeruleus]